MSYLAKKNFHEALDIAGYNPLETCNDVVIIVETEGAFYFVTDTGFNHLEVGRFKKPVAYGAGNFDMVVFEGSLDQCLQYLNNL